MNRAQQLERPFRISHRIAEKRLRDAGLPVMGIAELHDKAIVLTGEPEPLEFTDRPVAIVRYRDGSVIDVVRQVKN